MTELFKNTEQHQKTLAHKILVEQIKTQYQTLLPILFVNLIVSTSLVYGLWDIVEQRVLMVWLGLMLLQLCARVASYIIYKRYFVSAHVKRYALYFVLGTGITGLLWGIGSVIFFPVQLEYQLFILFVLIGMGAGAVSSLTVYLPAFFSYFPVSVIPISIPLFLVAEPIQISLGVMLIAYILALSYFGMNINRTLIQSLRLRFENIDLVEQLRQQKDEAEQANLSKSKFLAAASHDLRQPLHALTLFTSVLDESIQYPKMRKVVEQINASVQALQSLFNALLDISRLDAGVMQIEKTDFYLQPLFEKLANDFNPQASEKGLLIHWPTCAYAVHSDLNLCEQILRNYISNSIRYSNTGDIHITCKASDEIVCIRVTDTGIGIPASAQKKIFDEFHQLNNPERDRNKGLGLGLAIVQRTATLLGHSIGLESTLGKGSTFFINIEQTTIDKDVIKIGNLSDNPVFPINNNVLIVVIDDELSIREATKSLLETWGCEVVTAVDQAEVITKMNQLNRPPDGIIADYRLRENKTGIEAIHAIEAAYKTDIPALIITGDTGADRLREVNNSGYQVLHKPVAPVKLRTFLRNIQLKSK